MSVSVLKIPLGADVNLDLLRLPKSDERLMHTCISMSQECFIGSINNHMACMWGLVPPYIFADRAYLWLYTNDLVREHPFIFVRHSQMVLKEMLEYYPVIVGHCHHRDDRAIRWIKWLGATFGEPEGLRIPFTIRKRHG